MYLKSLLIYKSRFFSFGVGSPTSTSGFGLMHEFMHLYQSKKATSFLDCGACMNDSLATLHLTLQKRQFFPEFPSLEFQHS